MNESQKKDLEDYKSKIEPVNYKPRVRILKNVKIDKIHLVKKENLINPNCVIEAVYKEFRNKEKFKDFYFVPENEFKELLEIKEAIMDLAHIIGPMIPEGSKLEQIVYKWSKEK